MAKTAKSSSDKKKFIGWSYLVDRTKYLHSIGEYRCDKYVDSGNECPEQCVKCSEYYTEK